MTVVERLAHSPRGSFLSIFLLSFGIQCFFLTKVPERHIAPHTRWEMQAVAISLAESGTFADPYALPTGPTAHLPPVMPAIVGLIYRLFGLTLTAGYVAWLFRIATYAAMDAMLPWVSGRLGIGRAAGLLAGVGRALVPTWPGHGEALTALVMALLLVLFVKRWTRSRGEASIRSALLTGLFWGVAFHLQPALLPVLLGCLVFELWWSASRRRWLGSVTILLGVVLACAPWAWRNYALLDGVFFIRSNFGLELRMGNHDQAAAAMDVIDARHEHRHPRTHLEEARLVQEIGEVPYMRRARREAMAWIRENPGSFVRLTVQRAVHFWLGPLHRPFEAAGVTAVLILALLGLRRVLPVQSASQRAAMLIPLLTFPLVYYFVAYMIRYTVPLSWIPALLAAAEVRSWLRWR
jgi:hypothetical protein